MIKEVVVKNFKSIKEAKVSFSESLSILIGLNGAGKTNLLKAIKLIRNLTVGMTVDDAVKDMVLVPSELFFLQDVSSDIFLSISVEGNEKKFLYEIVLEGISDASSSLAIKIKHEKLWEFNEASEKIVIFKRELNNIVKNAFEENIPIDISSTQSVAGFYKQPSISNFKEIIRKVNIVNTDTISASRNGNLARFDDLNNIGSLIVRLKYENAEKFASFENTVKKLLPSISNILDLSSGEKSENDRLYLVLFEQSHIAGRISFKSISDGDIRTLMIILNTYLSQGGESSTLIIEEIENALHPHRLKMLLEYLKRACYVHNLQILLTTHSPSIIDNTSAADIIYVHAKNDTGSQFLQLKEAKYITKVQDVLREGGNLTDFIEGLAS